MRVALLLDERGAELYPLLGVGDDLLQCSDTGSEPERRYHQPGVAEHLVGLGQTLARDAADQVLDRDEHVVEGQRGRIGAR